MPSAPLPERESARLAALRAHGLLDSTRERAYDDIVRVAAQLCGTPTALVSLVDEERQWFKASVGLDVCETPRSQAFCAWAILNPRELLVVENALDDPRFADNPLVTGAANVRFYAGAPLVDCAGHALGTLCVIDTRPREFSVEAREGLAALARQVERQIESSRTCRLLSAANERLLEAERLLQARNANLDVLGQLGDLMLSVPVAPRILTRAMELARSFAGAELAALFVPGDVAGVAGVEAEPSVVAVSGASERLLEWLPRCAAWLAQPGSDTVRELRADDTTWIALQVQRGTCPIGTLVFACSAQQRHGAEQLETLRQVAGRLLLLREHALDERRRSLDASRLRESERRFRNLSDRSPVMIWMGDASGDCVYVNSSWLEFTGRTLEQELGGGWLEHVFGEDRERLAQTFRKAFEARAPFECEFRVPRPDGSLGWVLASGQPRWSEAEEFEGYVGSWLDITARVSSELATRSSRDEALEAVRVKSQFLANMSHEIRTPLNGVIGMLELLLAGDLQGETYHMVQVARSSGEALLMLLNDILDLSKMESGKLDIEHIAYEPRALAEGLATLFWARAREKGLELRVECAPGVPQGVLGDPTRLRQVLGNLLGNAIKFTASGGVILRLGVEDRSSGSRALTFEVEDSGPGLPVGSESWLFQSFSQADASTTRRFGGTGLGLAIARQLVGLMGGELGVQSRSGVGARFCFELPLALALETPPPALPTRTGLHRSFVDGAGLRVLVAEDNPVNREVVSRMLRLRGYEVVLALDGLETVEAAARTRFDLILMDCHMPRLDGYEATRRIRAAESLDAASPTPIVALTASTQVEDHDCCLAAGMDAVLTKPIRMVDLDAALTRWIARAARSPG